MDATSKNEIDSKKDHVVRRDSEKHRHENDNDEGTTWSMSSNAGISHDDGFVFQNLSTSSDQFLYKETNNEEYLKLNEEKREYFYDGIEEIMSNSDSEDDERLTNDQNRISFTREQLVEYQQLIKLFRFIKNGGRCTTILSLALLQDHNLQDQCAFLAFKDSSTMNILLNFLEMFDRDLKLNALYVLKDACRNRLFAYEIFRLGGIITIIQSICFDHIGIEESCVILLEILLFHRARKVIRRSGGICKLIHLLNELSENLIDNHQKIDDLFEVFLLLCKSKKNKYVSIRYGIGEILLKIISKNSSKSILSLLSILLHIPIFRMQMMNIDLILNLINLIDLKNIDLTRVICECLYYFSFDRNLLEFIYENGLNKFKDLLEQINDPSIFCSIINILIEFMRKNENLSQDLVLNMIQFLRTSSDLFYLSRIFKGLNQLTKIPQTIKLFKQEKIFSNLIFHLENQNNHFDIQLNILAILEQCGKDKQSAQMIVDNNGLQQLWTLYKFATLPIQIAAGWTIRNCLASIENHGELTRSFDGIFYFILKTLTTENIDLLAVTLAIIAEIVKDEYNLEILTDLGITSKISQLTNLDNPQLKKPFCDAIANLLNLRKNQEQFGNRRMMIILKKYLKEQDEELSQSLTKAIYDLSLLPSNCIILHDVGISSDLLQLIGNDHPSVQEKAANALRNMRRILDANRQVERTLMNDTHKVSARKTVHRRAKCTPLNGT